MDAGWHAGFEKQGTLKISTIGRRTGLFYKRFSWVRADPLDEGEAPFIKIEPMKKTNWGFARASAIV